MCRECEGYAPEPDYDPAQQVEEEQAIEAQYAAEHKQPYPPTTKGDADACRAIQALLPDAEYVGFRAVRSREY